MNCLTGRDAGIPRSFFFLSPSLYRRGVATVLPVDDFLGRSETAPRESFGLFAAFFPIFSFRLRALWFLEFRGYPLLYPFWYIGVFSLFLDPFPLLGGRFI